MGPRSERDKMLAGELYLASDPELRSMRRRARRLTLRYNATDAEHDAAERERLLRELMGEAGAGLHIEPPFHCDYGTHIVTGENVFMNFDCVVLDCARVTLGNRVQLGPKVQLLTATHPLDAAARAAGPELARPITLGDDVWLGGGVTVCPGVSIGAGSVVGAGAVVTRDVPPGVVAAGVPCRVLRPIPAGA